MTVMIVVQNPLVHCLEDINIEAFTTLFLSEYISQERIGYDAGTKSPNEWLNP